MKRNLLILVVVSMLFLSGCSGTVPTPKVEPEVQVSIPTPVVPQHPDAIKRDALETYTARFDISFDGATPWKYQLIMRKSKTLHELQFHVEGLTGEENLGDVRLVTDGITSWMTGAGTDNECIQVPTNSELNPTFIYPEDVLSMQELLNASEFIREEPYAGRTSLYYLAGPVAVGSWKNASIEFHHEKDREAMLQFALLGSGEDPFYGTGSGTIMATYAVESLDEPVIELVGGCDISVMLPETAEMFVRIPGMASFESADTPEAMAAFYQEHLPLAGWEVVEELAGSESAVVLSYARETEQVEIRIKPISTGSKVEIFFFPTE